MTYRAFVVTALLAAAVIVVSGAAGDPGNGDHKKLAKIQHIVVIYEENHSFDNLYGGWEGVNGRVERRRRAHHPGQPGRAAVHVPAAGRRQPDVAAAPADCTDTATGAPFTSHFPNAPFSIEQFIPPTRARPVRSRACSRRTGCCRARATCRAAARATSCTASTRSSTSSTAASRTAT